MSRFWRGFNDLQKTLNIRVVFVPYYHQATNGIIERAHGTIKTGLKTMLVEMGQAYKQDWYILTVGAAVLQSRAPPRCRLIIIQNPLWHGPGGPGAAHRR